MSVTISGSGQIIKQVIVGTYSSAQVTTSSTTPVATGLTANITPTNSANKILVLINATFNAGAGNGVFGYVTRNGSTVSTQSASYGSSAGVWDTVALHYLDSPATTSSTTYALYFAASGGTVGFNWTTGWTATITLMEVAYA